MSLINSISGIGNVITGAVQPQPRIGDKMKGGMKELTESTRVNNAEAIARVQSAKMSAGVGGIEGVRSTDAHAFVGGPQSADPSIAPSFGEMLDSLVESVDKKQKISRAAAADIMTGKSDNIHQAMIAAQEAGVAFTMLVEVRNKLTESYQQLTKMTI